MVPALLEAAATLFIDPEHSGWFAIRDPQGNRKVHPWYGKPDIYHSLQACLLPLLPLAPSATAAAAGSAGAAVASAGSAAAGPV